MKYTKALQAGILYFPKPAFDSLGMLLPTIPKLPKKREYEGTLYQQRERIQAAINKRLHKQNKRLTAEKWIRKIS